MADFDDDVRAASLLLLPFVCLVLALGSFAPPNEAELAASDPLIQSVDAVTGLWAIPLLSFLPVLAWLATGSPSRDAMRSGAVGAAAGLLLAALGLPLLRALVGPSLPSFVPPEESALAGLTLGVGAGVLEEALFRLGMLAPIFVAAQRLGSPTGLGSRHGAAALAILATSFAFALAHELGPGGGDFDPRFFATRFLIPGCGMGLAFVYLGPAFLITLHCAAHVGIALLFTGVATGG